MRGVRPLARHLLALLSVAVTLVLVWLIHAKAPELQTTVLLYLVPIILVASTWGRGPSITAALAAVLGHDVFLVQPAGTLVIARAEDALGLVILLFTALVTSQLADSARRGAEGENEAALARRSDELKTALLRAVSHDLRTPLASIKASVSGLRQAGGSYSDEDRAELLAAIEEEADRLARLVTNLLDASRLEAGVLTPHERPQDLRELVATVVGRLQPLLTGRQVRIDIPEDMPPVPCDYAQIDQIVTNLVENAAVHTPPGTPVTIRATVEGDEVRSEVVDQGLGLPASERERLFRPFERGESHARGSGLGLAIARGLVEAHGGRLWAEDAPTGGTRFIFTLPLRRATP